MLAVLVAVGLPSRALAARLITTRDDSSSLWRNTQWSGELGVEVRFASPKPVSLYARAIHDSAYVWCLDWQSRCAAVERGRRRLVGVIGKSAQAHWRVGGGFGGGIDLTAGRALVDDYDRGFVPFWHSRVRVGASWTAGDHRPRVPLTLGHAEVVSAMGRRPEATDVLIVKGPGPPLSAEVGLDVLGLGKGDAAGMALARFGLIGTLCNQSNLIE